MGTDHCELCNAALDWLLASPLARGLPLSTVDVSTDPRLFERYAERVPVLVLRRGEQIFGELGWPFTEQAFETLLRHPDLLAGEADDH